MCIHMIFYLFLLACKTTAIHNTHPLTVYSFHVIAPADFLLIVTPSTSTASLYSITLCHLPSWGSILFISFILAFVGYWFVRQLHFMFGIFGSMSLRSRNRSHYRQLVIFSIRAFQAQYLFVVFCDFYIKINVQ